MHSVISSRSSRRAIKEEGRRAQIIAATIYTLAELGYSNTSLAQIAKRASISTSLILYHFKDKDELLLQTLTDITAKWLMYSQTTIHQYDDPRDKLHAYIRSNLTFMIERPAFMAARIEITFNTRSKNGRLLLQSESYSNSISMLENILEEGRYKGLFGNFNTASMALVIRSSIDQFLGLMKDQTFDAAAYIRETTALFDKATRPLA